MAVLFVASLMSNHRSTGLQPVANLVVYWVLAAVVVAIALSLTMRSLLDTLSEVTNRTGAGSAVRRYHTPKTEVTVWVQHETRIGVVSDEPDEVDRYVFVRAANTGARTVTVNSWGVSLPTRRKVVWFPRQADTPRLPHELRPGGEVIRFPIDAADLRRIATEENISCDDMHAYVSLVDGTEFHAKDGIPLP